MKPRERLPEPEPTPNASGVSATATDARVERAWLPLAAYAFVLLALIALAIAPALLLRNVSEVTRRMTTVVLPAYEGLKDFAFALEARVAAARTQFVAVDDRYAIRLEAARRLEAEALQTLRRLAPEIGPNFAVHLDTLEVFMARRDSLEADVVRRRTEPDAYRNALPQFDALRDSMLVHVTLMQRALLGMTQQRLAEEAQSARLHRTLSGVLGAVAVLAVLIVGWFGLLQRKLRRQVQRGLIEADALRAQSDRRRAELERLTESRARLTRGFTHDLKNPLGAASGYLELLKDGYMGEMTEEQMRGVERAHASIGAALGLVEDLLELARTEGGNIEFHPAPIDLGGLVHEVAAQHRAQAESKQLTLDVQLPARLPSITADGKRVGQVLGNLLGNAVKYTESGSVTVLVEARPAADGRAGYAIAVRDTGPGVAPEHHESMFEEFVRLDPAATKGAGVGLAISRRLARGLGGEILLESAPGAGSTFTFWLPETPPPPAGDGGTGLPG